MQQQDKKRVVSVEYCTSWGYSGKYSKLADSIKKNFQQVEVVGNPKGSSRTGSFEVTTEDGKVHWSKLGGQGFPEAEVVVTALKAHGLK